MKIKPISIMMASLLTASCAYTTHVSTLEEPTHSIIRTNNSPELETWSQKQLNGVPKPNKSNYFLGENQEIQCLGDMYAAYRLWDVEPNYSQSNTAPVITILPVSNQTNYKDVEIPAELTMATQKIATQLGIGHHVVFVPSKKDMENNVMYNNYQNVLSLINEPTNLHNRGKSNHIFIAASLIEYDDPNRIFGVAGNVSGTGTVDKKSFSAGASVGHNRFGGRMSMTFSVIYPASNVGIANTPQFVYHPDASVSVSLDFQHTSHENEFSVSYDGGKPTLGYRNNFQRQDSRFIATNLLIERGLLKVLGRLYRMPYWRCMAPNLIADNNMQIPRPLNSMRKMYGYDSHVEKSLRRYYQFTGDPALGVAPYVRRPESTPITDPDNKNNNQVWVQLVPLSQNGKILDNFDDIDDSTEITTKEDESQAKIISIPQKMFDINQPSLCSDKKPKPDGSRKSDKSGSKNYKEYNQCLLQKTLNTKGSTFQAHISEEDKLWLEKRVISRPLSAGITQPSIYGLLQEVAVFNAQTLSTNEKSEYRKYMRNLNKAKSREDAFVDLWMSLPYRVDSRIYPHYLNWQPVDVENFVGEK